MKQIKLLGVLTCLIWGNDVIAQPLKIIKDNNLQTGTYTWSKDTIYMLDGFVFLEKGGVLNIEAGTVIKGLSKNNISASDNASALIITRGAKIMADGTANEPIVFTAEIDDTSDPYDLEMTDKGLWGGLIILGYGQLAFQTDTANIEGIPTNETRAVYGGTNDDDNSGVLKYISIRHGGAELAPGNEINGLTFGGVGRGTVVDHVEVIANQDDGIEWFGGAVECKYLVSAFCGDDSYDYDFGWRGKGQFWFSIQGDDNADNAGEHDGAQPDGELPFSKPTIYNVTYIGSGVGAAAKNSTALHFRDAAGGIYANSIFTQFAQHALEVEDLPVAKGVDSRQRMEDGDLKLLNNIWYDFGAGDQISCNPDTGIIRFTSDGEDTVQCSFIVDHLTNNNNVVVDPELTSVSRAPDQMLDPRPKPGSPAYTGPAAYPNGDNFFDEVPYKGAFGDINWAMNWTALDTYGYLGDLFSGIFEKEVVKDFSLQQNYPNPVRDGYTQISFAIKKTGNVTLKVLDITGREISRVVNNTPFFPGTYSAMLSTQTIGAGIYFYSMEVDGVVVTKKMSIIQ